jgi:GT2 family glycosyltransferase
MEYNPAVGLAGCAVYNPDGTRHETVQHRYPGHSYSQGRFSGLPGEIAWLLGAALVGRWEALAATGGLDTDYFLYAEDIDLCLRMRQAGYPLGLIEEAGVMHLEGQSELKAPVREMLERKIRAELLFYEKHYPAAIRARIRRVRLLEAYWRIFSLQFTGLLPGKAAQRSEKLLRYETVRELYANWGREQ